MRPRLQIRWLAEPRRLHLQDGPIDLVVQAWGDAEPAYAAAIDRMATLLDELCAERPVLRAAAPQPPARDHTARAMQLAVAPYAHDGFITPMAAVAGAVADAVLAAMLDAAVLDRAFVNNGGDIALHLAPGQALVAGLVDRPDRPSLFARAAIRAEYGVRGIATSGWRGRSHSLGIADAVTVLAASAAQADAAATVIANAVDCAAPGIVRVAANLIDPGSDLGDRRVTRDVPPLAARHIAAALASGVARAQALCDHGLIHAAALHLQGQTRIVGQAALASSQTQPDHPALIEELT